MKESIETDKIHSKRELEELFQLLSGLSRQEIQAIKDAVLDKKNFRNKVASVLPAAVSDALKKDERLEKHLTPVVEKSVQDSITKNPGRLAQVLSPVMGPAIRNSIIQTLEGYISNLDLMIQNSLSIKSLKWRFQAWRQGVKYSEFVLRRMLKYRVERAIIFSKKDGIMLVGVSRQEAVKSDDLFSAMLTAISDFANDSLVLENQSPIRSVEIQDKRIDLAPGRETVLAIVSWGYLPSEFHTDMQEKIEDFEAVFLKELESFGGDTHTFKSFESELGNLLQDCYHEKEKRTPWIGMLIAFGILASILYLFYLEWDKSKQWESFVDDISKQPGLVITESKINGNEYYLQGLKDPLAINVREVFYDKFSVNKELITSFQPFYSVDPDFVLRRYQREFNPPKSLMATFGEDRVLRIQGRSTQDFYNQIKKNYSTLFGVRDLDISKVSIMEAAQFEAMLQEVMKTQIIFEINETALESPQKEVLNKLSKQLLLLQQDARVIGREAKFALNSYTGKSGTPQKNLELSEKRQKSIIMYLESSGVEVEINENHALDEACTVRPGLCIGQRPYIFFTVDLK